MKPIYDSQFFDSNPADGYPYGPWRKLNTIQISREHRANPLVSVGVAIAVLAIGGAVAVVLSMAASKVPAEISRALNPNCDPVKCTVQVGE